MGGAADLNYNHLRYFWLVAREGGVGRAAARLGVSHPTVSEQVRALEEALGAELLVRRGRSLALTETGEVVRAYADQIFSLGAELLDAVEVGVDASLRPLAVGVTEAMPKLLTFEILRSACEAGRRLLCREGPLERLVAALDAREVSVVFSEAPLPAGSPVRAESRLLGACGTTLLAAPALAARLREGFPASLDGAPLLLPTTSAPLREALDAWLAARGLRPRVAGELDDSALLKTFGRAGAGVFPVPTVIAPTVCEHYAVESVAELPEVRERFYAIVPPGELRPDVASLCAAARARLAP